MYPSEEYVTSETLDAVQRDTAKLGDRLAWSEAEAARLLGLEPHQLCDERLRGRIAFTSTVGRRIRYDRQSPLAYLQRNRRAPFSRVDRTSIVRSQHDGERFDRQSDLQSDSEDRPMRAGLKFAR